MSSRTEPLLASTASMPRSPDATAKMTTSDAIRLAIVVGWIVWSAAFAIWRELASPVIFGFGGVTVYPTDLLIAGTLIYGLLDLLDLLLGQESTREQQIIALLVGGYVTYTICIVWSGGILTGLSAVQAIRAVAPRFLVLLLPLVIGLLRRHPELEVKLLQLPALMVIPLVVSGAINAITHTYVVAAEEGYTRIRLLWGGSAILFAWAILVELVRPHVTRSRTAILLAVTGVIGILMANHRSAFIALLVVLPLLFRPRNKVARRLLVVLLLGLGAALVMLALVSLTPGDAFGYSAARLLDFTTGNGADRLMRWRLAAATFWATPFNDITWTDQWYLVDLARNYGPHNWILEVLVSEGVLGFAFYLGVFAQTLRYSRRWARQDGVVTGLSTFVAFFIVFCSFNANFYAMANQSLLWLAIALLSHRAEQLQQDAVIAAYSLEASGN